MLVMYDPGKPPELWTSRAGIHLAPDPRKAAGEVHDLEEEHARKWYSRKQQEEYDYNQDWEGPWDWAPVDVREDWGFSELDLEEEREGYLPPEGPWD